MAMAAGWTKPESAASTASIPNHAVFQAVIKSAASAASRKTKIQGSALSPIVRMPGPVVRALPLILVYLKDALAANLMTA